MDRGRGVPNIAPTPAPSSVEMRRLRQALYRLFGALFLYADADRLAKLRAAAGGLRQEGNLWGEAAFSSPLQELLEVLSQLTGETTGRIEEEYVRLFLAKPAAPPYESYYLDPEGQSRARIANQLEREYAQAGLALSPALKDLPDHIAVELEFMSFLCGQEAEAWEAEALEGGTRARERQRSFLGQHLGRWFPAFARRVREAAPGGLYAVVAEVAYAFLRHELDHLRLRGSL